ncbi:MAG TPA: patatin-like phospholipase family protein [Vicinamibacterales bacterium]|nr:patatin-like phospholipase family protein [Vicinamibacterales bacterium]
MSTQPLGLALVLSGGGARGAYQVGVLRILAREFPEAVPDILTGVSAGGINAAFLASRQEPYQQKVDELAEMWSHLRIDDVFRVDTKNLAWRALRWGGRLISGGKSPLPPAKSMVDTKPLREVLERELHATDGPLSGINDSLRSGWLRAFALTASSYTTGQSVTWVQTRDDCAMPAWERPLRKSSMCELRIDHVMASAALPFFFPAIEVDGAWYGDGGIRLTQPLSPAIHLGARRIIAVTTRYAKSREEADRPSIAGYPPPAQVAGSLFNAIFLDQLDSDAMQLRQINALIEAHPEEKRLGLRPIELLVLRPSEDLGRLANAYEANLPKAFRYFTRGLGTKETRSNDMLSLVMFQTDYVKRLIELGESDALAKRADIEKFLRPLAITRRAAR